MLSSLRSRTALLFVALAVTAAALMGVRALRRGLPVPEPVETAAVTEDAGAPAASGAAQTGPAPAEAVRPEPPARAARIAAAGEPVPTTSPTPASVTPPQTEEGRLFHDPRFGQVITGPVPAAPQAEAEASAARRERQPRQFEDTRSVARIEPDGRALLPRESGQPVAGRTAPAPAPFDDRRAIAPVAPGAAPMAEAATARVEHGRPAGSAGEATTVAPAAARPPPAPSFSDPRGLDAPPSPPRDVAERPEIVPRSLQGQLAVPREGEGAPASIPAPAPVAAALPAPPPALSPALPPAPAPSLPVAAATPPPAVPARLAAIIAPTTASLAPPATPCPPAQIGSEALDGGRMLVRIGSTCRAGRTVRLGYGGAMLEHTFDQAGRLEATVDLFAGTTTPVEIVFDDGASRELPVRGNDLDRIEKVALIWQAPVDLDLHVFEYGAAYGQPGHVWAEAPSSALAAREQAAAAKRGRGFLSRTDAGRASGDKIEVYTYFRHAEQSAGAISFAVDHATRGDRPSGAACGVGPLAEVRFETVVVARGRVAREAGVIAAAACGAVLAPEARYGIVHQLRVAR